MHTIVHFCFLISYIIGITGIISIIVGNIINMIIYKSVIVYCYEDTRTCIP